jgi:hypothetical protein
VTSTAASRHAGTSDLLVDEVLGTNQLPERR